MIKQVDIGQEPDDDSEQRLLMGNFELKIIYQYWLLLIIITTIIIIIIIITFPIRRSGTHGHSCCILTYPRAHLFLVNILIYIWWIFWSILMNIWIIFSYIFGKFFDYFSSISGEYFDYISIYFFMTILIILFTCFCLIVLRVRQRSSWFSD